jgi:hypothetical protein
VCPSGDVPLDIAGRVERSGIALVHEGEYIGPDPSSSVLIVPTTYADSSRSTQDGSDEPDDREVHYYFPIEVEVIGSADAGVVDAVAARVFDELQREMASRP